MRRRRRRLDPVLLGAVALLLSLGSFMVYSASLVVAYTEFHDDTYFLVRQLSWIFVGLVVLTLLTQIDYHFWQRYSLIILLLGIGLLVVLERARTLVTSSTARCRS